MPNVYETTDAAANTGTTYTLNMGDIVQGSLTLGDRDFYRVNLVAGQTYTFSLVGTGVNNVSDPILRLYTAGAVYVTGNDDGLQSRNSQLVYTPGTSGTYYLDAAAFNNA